MAISQIKRGPMYRTVSTSSGTTVTATGSFQYFEEVGKPNPVRRPKPTDLFANSTSRSLSRDITIDSYYTEASGSTLTTAPVTDRIGGGNLPSGVPNDSSGVSAAVRAKIKSQNLNLAQSCAEYRQTCSMFVGLARDLISGFRSLRNGRAFADFIRILQQPRNAHERRIANRWLEYQYGMRPLMSDIYGATDALATRIRTGFPQYVTIRRKNQGEYKEIFSPTSHFRRSWVWDSTYQGKARYIIRDAALKQLAQCGITNPLLLVWELIPYSFVVDWAFPVGQFLSSLDALNGTQDLRYLYVDRRHYLCTFGYRDGTATRERWTYDRVAANSIPLPSLGYKPSSSLTAVLNGLALLTQIRTGR